MAPSISHLDDIQTSVFTDLARRFFVDPTSEKRFDLDDLSPIESVALARLTESVGTSIDELRTRTSDPVKLLALISDVLQARTLAEGRGTRVIERLSERGELRLAEYRVTFNNTFARFEQLGTRRSHVIDALQDPSVVQHTVAPGVEARFPGISLIAKLVEPKRSAPFVLLVQARRQGSDLVIQSAWRVPPKIAATSKRPLDMLRGFITEFGLRFSIGGREFVRFAMYEAFPIMANVGQPTDLIKIENPLNHSFVQTFALRVSPLNVAEIAIAYVIDIAVYEQFLRDLK